MSTTNEMKAGEASSLEIERPWWRSLDHKRIALTYLGTLAVVLAIGVAFALRLGIERLSPGGTAVRAGAYARALSVHGVVMVFLLVVPAIPVVLGTFVLPLMLGARNVAFPRLARAGLWLYWAGAALALAGVMTATLRSGWTFSEAYDGAATSGGVLAVMGGALLVSITGLLHGLNTIVSIHKLRTTGLSWGRLPLFVWAAYGASIIAILAPAPLGLAFALAVAERALHVGIFDPALGGDPLLFQHLFWFYAHPLIVGVLLWAMGVASELLGVHARRRPFGYRIVAPLFLALAVLSFTQWGIHLVGSGASGVSASIFSLLALLSLAPQAIVLGNWLATLRGGSNARNAPMLFGLSLALNLTIWLASAAALGMLGLGAYLRGTPFEVAHLHYGFVGVGLTAVLGGLVHWWPKLTGHTVDERLAKAGAIGLFFGVQATFFGQFVVGLSGMVHGRGTPTALRVLDTISGLGSWVLVAAIVLIAGALLESLRSARAAANPWGAGSLEWQTSSPPPAENFDRRPQVRGGPYDFAGPTPAE